MSTLYRFYSHAIGSYAVGHVIVLAETPEEAKTKARVVMNAWHLENRSYMYLLDDGTPDPDWGEEIMEFERAVTEDLADEPCIVETGVICIRGSD